MPGSIFAQHTLSGTVRDAATGKVMDLANVILRPIDGGMTSGRTQASITDSKGRYTLGVASGNYELSISFIGYRTEQRYLQVSKDLKLNISLKPDSELLRGVEVSADRPDANIRDIQMSVEKLSVAQIEKLPSFLGEADIIKSLQLAPGVSSVGEGATGFNVRGGNIDQNLILFNEAPVYSSSHLFGFFSVFSPNAVDAVSLYKGGISPQYGGRLSSILAVEARSGNMQEFKGDGGVGLIFSRLALEGPIVKDKLSYLITGRRSYGDLFLKFTKDYKDIKAYFYDYTGELKWRINDKNNLTLAHFTGFDAFKLNTTFDNAWGNRATSLKWVSDINSRWLLVTNLVHSNYLFDLTGNFGDLQLNALSKIENYKGKIQASYTPNEKHQIVMGAEAVRYRVDPGLVSFDQTNEDGVGLGFNFDLDDEFAAEYAVFIGDEYQVNEKLSLQYGLRYSYYQYLGPKTQYSYGEPGLEYQRPSRPEDITDSTRYSRGEVVKHYGNWEPRLAINYVLNEKSSIKLSYQRMAQYIQLASNTTAAAPQDVWKLADTYLKPALADQIAVGYFRNFYDNSYEFSSELYYKHSQNLLEYKNGAQLFGNPDMETDLVQGRGRAYGMELQLKKKTGRLSGFIAYTLGKSEIQVEGYTEGNYVEMQGGINQGAWYPSNWDKRHELSLATNYTINEKWDLGGTFVYSTGRPTTYPDGIAEYDGKKYPVYSRRNQGRTPHTHRLDFSATYTVPQKKKRKWQSSWVFSVYNLYSHDNPYSVYFNLDDSSGNLQAYQLSIIAAVVPAVSYNFKF